MCWCYYSAADRAQATKNALEKEKESLESDRTELETEKQELTDEKTEISTARTALFKVKTMVSKYASTFNQLGAAMENVKVNGGPYDKGRCYEIASEIQSVADAIQSYLVITAGRVRTIHERLLQIAQEITAINDRITEIDGMIPDLNTKINRRNWTCNSCRALAAKNNDVTMVAM